MDPEILCFDEPTSALDPQLTQEVLCVIRQLAAEKRTMIVVTHEMNFARDVAGRVIYMENGLVAEDGPAKEVLGQRPQRGHPRVRRGMRRLSHHFCALLAHFCAKRVFFPPEV